MTWTLSQYHAGEFVEVRSRDEILATLDEHALLRALPFMPEMLQFCGKRFRVRAVAHKTCETAQPDVAGATIQATVHLADLRCDGSAHGGCQAACTLFWKDAWLKPADSDDRHNHDTLPPRAETVVCSEAQLLANTISQTDVNGDEPCYVCQVTKLYDATKPLAWWDMRQYVLDVTTGNHSVGRVLRVTLLAVMRTLNRSVEHGNSCGVLFWRTNEWMHLS